MGNYYGRETKKRKKDWGFCYGVGNFQTIYRSSGISMTGLIISCKADTSGGRIVQ